MSPTTKEQLAEIISGLSDEDVYAVAAFALFLHERSRSVQVDDPDDALIALLKAAPLDDEPSTPEEDNSADESWRELRRNRNDVSSPRVMMELLGLTDQA